MFFSEQGKVPKIRLFDGTQVTTIYQGAPLKNISDLCSSTASDVLICDRGSECIWMLNIVESIVTIKIDISLLKLAGISLNSFYPSSIVKVAEGSFVFTDAFSHKVFRYLDEDCCINAYVSTRDCYSAVTISRNDILNASNLYINLSTSLLQLFRNFLSKLLEHKNKILASNYGRVLDYIKVVNFPLSTLNLSHLILGAPSLVSLSKFLRNLKFTSSNIRQCNEYLTRFLIEYNFCEQHYMPNISDELVALANMFIYLPDAVTNQETLCTLLKDER